MIYHASGYQGLHACELLSFLQVSFAQQFPAMNTDSDTWTHQKLKFTVTKDIWSQAGPLGGVFSMSHTIARRMSRLQLTDVEISLFAALLLFCSGKICWGYLM